MSSFPGCWVQSLFLQEEAAVFNQLLEELGGLVDSYTSFLQEVTSQQAWDQRQLHQVSQATPQLRHCQTAICHQLPPVA